VIKCGAQQQTVKTLYIRVTMHSKNFFLNNQLDALLALQPFVGLYFAAL
jgi:hypothetical protein